MKFPNKMFINGQWLTGSNFMPVLNKYSQETISAVPIASPVHTDNAISAALKALPRMKSMPTHQRSQILTNTSQQIDRHQHELATLIAMEAGKPWKYALGEVKRAVETFRFAAEEAKQIHGATIPMDASVSGEGRFGFYLREPVGVIAAITPFNFPLNLVAHKIAPALAAGNSVVLKPASATPLTSLKLAEIIAEAGLPAGSLNVIMGSGSTVGNQLVEDRHVSMVTFTGSPPVGKHILRSGGLKKYTMELGSNSAVIVCDDADIAKAVNMSVTGSFAYSGQVCISVQRIYIHKSVFEKFTTAFIKKTGQLAAGNPVDKDCDIGPMIDEAEARRVEQWVDDAVASGARCMLGGTREGTTYHPTVLTNVHADMQVIKDELFGPVVSLIPFQALDEAIAAVDDSRYGLQVGIFTQRIDAAFQAIRQINVGGVMINNVPTYRVDHMPYGGNKQSGIGREGLKYAIEEMTHIKMVCFH